MTAEELKKEYLSNKRRIKNLKQKIEDEYTKDLTAVAGKVKGSSSNFPYSERRFSTYLNDPSEEKARHKRVHDWQQEINEKQKKVNTIEELIHGIKNSLDKEIFIYYFFDNKNQAEIAKIVHLDRSRISRKMSENIKTHTKHTNSML